MANVMDAQLTTSQAARLLALTDTRVLQLSGEGKLHPRITPLGRLFDRAEVERLRQARRRAKGRAAKAKNLMPA